MTTMTTYSETAPLYNALTTVTSLRDNEIANSSNRTHEDVNTSAKLIFLCGKMAAGKSTLARILAQREDAVLLVEDEFLNALFPGEIIDIAGYARCSSRLKSALAAHVCGLLPTTVQPARSCPEKPCNRRESYF